MKYLIPFLAVLASPLFADQIDPGEVAGLPAVDVVFIGELHDNPWHHENQTVMVMALAPKAIVFEMLTPEQAGLVTDALLLNQDVLEQALGWNNSGWPDFAMYYPIFRAGTGAGIYGAQVSRADVRDAIMGEDLTTTFGQDAAQYGLGKALDETEQATREAEQLEAHCNALPEVMLPGMVLGQRLRDATLAREIERALAETGGPVLVITGNGHARKDWGAPRALSGHITQLSIGQFEQARDGAQPFDHWVLTPKADREDPCLVFGKS